MQYLEFEKPIEELVKKLNQAKDLGKDQSVDVTKTIFDLESKIKLTRKNIYENVPALPLFSLNNILDLPINRWRNKIVNDFELPIFQKYFELEKAKERFYKQGAIYSSLTGTGSAIYAIFDK